MKMYKYNMALLALLSGAKAIKVNPTAQSQVLSQVDVDAEFWNDMVSWFNKAANDVVDAVEDLGNEIEDVAEGVVDFVEDAANDVADWVEEAANDVADWVEEAANDVADWAEEVGIEIVDAFEDAGEWIEGTWEDAGDWVEGAWDDAGEWWEDALDDAEDWFVGAGEDIGNWFEEAGEDIAEWAEENGIVDFFEHTWELVEDIAAVVAEWSDNIGLTDAFEDAGQWIEGAWYDVGAALEPAADFFVDVVDTLDDAIDDAMLWISDNSNWEALGKVLGGTLVLTFSGEFDQAGALLTNDQMYLGSTWEAIEAAQNAETTEIQPAITDAENAANEAEKQRLLQEARDAYDGWKQNQMAALAPIALKVKNAIEAKQAMCGDSTKPPVGQEAYRVTRRGERVNFTSYTLQKMPPAARQALMGLMGDGEVSKGECKDADCLHPCFGPLHASNCNKCYKTWVQTRGRMKSKACDLCEIEYEEWTEPHIMTFEEKMIDIGKEYLLQ